MWARRGVRFLVLASKIDTRGGGEKMCAWGLGGFLPLPLPSPLPTLRSPPSWASLAQNEFDHPLGRWVCTLRFATIMQCLQGKTSFITHLGGGRVLGLIDGLMVIGPY